MTFLLQILLIAATHLPAQRHLPQTQVFRSPGYLVIDTRVESPAVYDGSGPVRLLKQGESFEVQVFAPRVAGQRIYEYSFQIEKPWNRKVPLAITSARDFQENELTSGNPNPTLMFSSTRFGIAPLPRTGHVMTLTFTATEDMPDQAPLDVILTVTVVSDPPRRVNQIVGRQRLYWG
jgi:hypothetical protein